MSISQFFRMLWSRRWIAVITTAVALAIAALVLVFLPTRYEATSRVMLDIVKPDPVTGEVISSSWARAYVATQVELIRDHRVAGAVAQAAGWQDSAELSAEYENSGMQADMDFNRWLAQKLIDQTTVKMVPATNILDITVSSTDAEEASRLANLVREAYVEQTITARREAAGRNAEWFRKQTDTVRTQLTAAEKKKTEFERANGVVITADNNDVDTARLQALAGSAPSMPAVTMGGGGGVAPSAGALAQIDAAIASAGRNLGPNHPGLQQLRQQRAVLAQNVQREMAASRPTTTSSGPSLETLYSQQQARVLRNAGAADEARRLATDVTVLREQYRNTAARAGQLDQEAQSTESGLTLLGDAVVPQEPAFPNKPLIIFGSLIAGLGLGILIGLAMELFNRRIRGVEELYLVDAPMLGAMGQTNEQIAAAKKRGFRFRPRPSAA